MIRELLSGITKPAPRPRPAPTPAAGPDPEPAASGPGRLPTRRRLSAVAAAVAGLALVGGLAGWLGGSAASGAQPTGARPPHAGGVVRSSGNDSCGAQRQGVVCTVERLLDN
ncbi:MAG TPA: hypothetical protein VEJ21_01050 [Acidimicrobiales bacterium]|nr:hypothetical protein [Acidimicrobiales bacterium]